jgi:hypothetical protein
MIASPAPLRSEPTITYDTVRDRTNLFGGGELFGGSFHETWEFDGTAWSLASPTVVAPGRRAGTTSYDLGRRRVVLFGGADHSGALFDDTWLYDGTAWTEVLTAFRPSARRAASMVYDQIEGRIILFGGIDASGLRGDTWSLGHTAIATGEACHGGIDYDGDGAIGCDDDECWTVCTPTCPPDLPATACAQAGPRCGDGVCSAIEDCHLCPADCIAGTHCPIRCGDTFCDAPETVSTCPGDCTP